MKLGPSCPRSAFTLMEMLLVLALLTIIAAISVPSLQDMYADYVQEGAADAVRAVWAEARVHAIDEGRPYRFAIVRGQGNYRVAPDAPEFWSGSDPAPGNGEVSNWTLQGALPRGIRFADGDALAGTIPDGETSLAADAVSPDQWSSVVTFLPDGTASQNVEILFQSRSARPLRLTLRAMTGSVTAVRLRSDGTP